MRKDAVKLDTLLRTLDPSKDSYESSLKHLRLLELRLQHAGMNMAFLHGDYGQVIRGHFAEKETLCIALDNWLGWLTSPRIPFDFMKSRV
ncbi:DnaJ family domain-containing protein [Izhakiella capsodis]|uniref:hypothetical protein n=1 Tax=Izhakiella capsodis TaxID=1367852 RepID=UPI0038B27809